MNLASFAPHDAAVRGDKQLSRIKEVGYFSAQAKIHHRNNVYIYISIYISNKHVYTCDV